MSPTATTNDLTVVIIAYNEARMLPMCLSHLPRGTRVRLVDGAYADFPHDAPYSTDGTLDLAERWGCEVVRVTEPWEHQMAKRTASLVPGVNFILDADEFLHTDLPHLPDDADVGWVTCASPIYEDSFLMPRVIRVQEGFHYAGRHHWVYDAAGDLVTSHTYAGSKYRHAILPVCISNARDMREPIRDGEKSAYLRSRKEREAAYADEACVYGGATHR